MRIERGIGETLTNTNKSETKDKLAHMPCKDLKLDWELAVEEGCGKREDRIAAPHTALFPCTFRPGARMPMLGFQFMIFRPSQVSETYGFP